MILMTNPPNSDAIANEIRKNRDEQSEENRHAFVFNFFLVAVGLLQGAALIYTALVSNKAANAAKAAAEHIPRVERAYLFLQRAVARIPPDRLAEICCCKSSDNPEHGRPDEPSGFILISRIKQFRDHPRHKPNYARRIAANIARLPELLLR
jgi:hypothetical protein